MILAFASDHAGFRLKEFLKAQAHLPDLEILDLGAHSSDPVDYPDYAEAAGRAIQQGRAERAVLLCGSGVGAAIAANKLRGIRAGLCHDAYSARQGVEHDDMNVLVLGARVVGDELARSLLDAFLQAQFTGEERHLRRLAKIAAIETREG